MLPARAFSVLAQRAPVALPSPVSARSFPTASSSCSCSSRCSGSCSQSHLPSSASQRHFSCSSLRLAATEEPHLEGVPDVEYDEQEIEETDLPQDPDDDQKEVRDKEVIQKMEYHHRQLALVYDCNICNTRSAKSFSHKAYTEGVVIVRCPECKNQHLIADNMGWFSDQKTNIETEAVGKGRSMKRVNSLDALFEDGTAEIFPEEITKKLKSVAEHNEKYFAKEGTVKVDIAASTGEGDAEGGEGNGSELAGSISPPKKVEE